MKIVYIAHPIGGDVQGNVKKLQEIYREITLTEPTVVPFIPYLASVQSLNDDDPRERKLGFDHNFQFFVQNVISEVWLYGSHVSKGMEEEISWARMLGLPVVAMSEGTKSVEVLNGKLSQ
jgi:hypothetical protein